jgi:hypothetical protein
MSQTPNKNKFVAAIIGKAAKVLSGSRKRNRKRRATTELLEVDDALSVASVDSTGLEKVSPRAPAMISQTCLTLLPFLSQGAPVTYQDFRQAHEKGKLLDQVAIQCDVEGKPHYVSQGPCDLENLKPGDPVFYKSEAYRFLRAHPGGDKVQITNLAGNKDHKPLLKSIKKLVPKPAAAKEEAAEF